MPRSPRKRVSTKDHCFMSPGTCTSLSRWCRVDFSRAAKQDNGQRSSFAASTTPGRVPGILG